jgi:lipopolysaccharide transport system ATP-binding protein
MECFMRPATVQTNNLGKTFRLYERSSDRFIEWLSLGRKHRHSDFWALKEINLAVYPGECVGLVGPNGAGKSTLLRIIAGTLSASEGTLSVEGRVLSLLELGSGFNPELTGRENVVNTAQLLGFPEDYARCHLADIEQFADLGPFMDRPIKTYSSGMVVRLAFSMFAFFDPDVLIIDEALAVGDAAFQRKCFRRMEELIGDGNRAVILASHDAQSIVKLCKRVYWLDRGTVRQSGDPTTVVQEYLREMFSNNRSTIAPPIPGPVSIAPRLAPGLNYVARPSTVPPQGRLARSAAAIIYPSVGVEVLGLWLEDQDKELASVIPVDEPFAICYCLRFIAAVERPVFGIRVTTVRGDCLIATNTQMLQLTTGNFLAGQTTIVRWPILPGFAVGDYFISCGCSLEDDIYRFLMREVDGYQFSVVGQRQQGGLCSLTGTPQVEKIT